MKNVLLTLLIGCFILAIWIFFDQESQPMKGSQIENVTQQSEAPNQKKQVRDTVRVAKKTKSLSQPVSQSIKTHKTVLKTVVEEVEESPIEALERPDEMVYPSTREGINDVMVQFLPNISDCYNQALEVHPDMGGRLLVSFRIEKPRNGDLEQDLARISEVEILDSDIDHEHFENCIMDNIDAFWFDPPKGDHIDVQLPFVFSSE